MKVTTTRFGEIEFPDHTLLRFPSGIIGFPESTRFVILDHDREAPFKWLQSADEPWLAFVIMDPASFKPDYCPDVDPMELFDIGSPPDDDRLQFVILTVPHGDPSGITANLRGPVMVNERTRQAKQVILKEELPTRYPVFSRPSDAVSARPELVASR